MEINTEDLFEKITGYSINDVPIISSDKIIEKEIKEPFDSIILNHNELCDIIDNYEDIFDYSIKDRGEDYYKNNNIVSIARTGNTFISKIDGNKRYKVEINFDEKSKTLKLNCTCPCNFPCKHEYAVLLAIKNNEYNQTELKPIIKKIEYSFQKLIELIPAEELKKYILNEEGKENVCFEMEHFENHFAKYLPRQTYEYYYNNLYNSLILDGYTDITYINIARSLINSGEYQEAFYVIKSIIEVANDIKVLNKWNDLIDKFPTIGMILRIIYRKSNNIIKYEIDEWLKLLENNNYYESLYLEDIVLSIR